MPDGDTVQPGFTERRRHPRRTAGTSVMVRVLVEEDTFSPLHFEGRCENISQSGTLVTVEGLPGELYKKMIRRPRYVRVICGKSEQEPTLTLFGKLIWYDYQNEPEIPVCKLAIAFEAMKEEMTDALDRYIESLPAEPQGRPHSAQETDTS